MPSVDLTPAKLAELRQKAEATEPIGPSPWRFSKTIEEYRTLCEVRDSGDYQVVYDMSVEEGEHIAAADPATVLAMVEEIAVLQRTVRNLVTKYQYDAYDDDIEYEIDQARHQLEKEAGQ